MYEALLEAMREWANGLAVIVDPAGFATPEGKKVSRELHEIVQKVNALRVFHDDQMAAGEKSIGEGFTSATYIRARKGSEKNTTVSVPTI